MTDPRTEIDKLRHDLRVAKQGLSDCTKALHASEQREGDLRKEVDSLKSRMHQALTILLPEGTTLSNNWDNFQEPGY